VSHEEEVLFQKSAGDGEENLKDLQKDPRKKALIGKPKSISRGNLEERGIVNLSTGK